ncbi:MAG: NAD(P)-dependent oxidoreductase [Actinobacteria bacterium]|nr:NAD(P)-dependent oxidoreductase [Actinomycetota bacterium]
MKEHCVRILFTGGSGKAGRVVAPYLAAQGHTVLNVDLVPLGHEDVHDIRADLTDPGQIWSAFFSYTDTAELDAGEGPPVIDAVVHFAAVPAIMLTADTECFRTNTIGTYNVLEAATRLGVRKIVLASSETTYGICFADGVVDPPRLPLREEDTQRPPMDSYALSKVCNEATARTFHERTGADIYALRIGNVWDESDYAQLTTYLADPGVRRRNAFNYVDARDLGQIVDLCVQHDGLGYQVFNATNDTNVAHQSARELASTYFPGVPLDDDLGEHEALMTNRKARNVLGFRPQHDWRDRV